MNTKHGKMVSINLSESNNRNTLKTLRNTKHGDDIKVHNDLSKAYNVQIQIYV